MNVLKGIFCGVILCCAAIRGIATDIDWRGPTVISKADLDVNQAAIFNLLAPAGIRKMPWWVNDWQNGIALRPFSNLGNMGTLIPVLVLKGPVLMAKTLPGVVLYPANVVQAYGMGARGDASAVALVISDDGGDSLKIVPLSGQGSDLQAIVPISASDSIDTKCKLLFYTFAQWFWRLIPQHGPAAVVKPPVVLNATQLASGTGLQAFNFLEYVWSGQGRPWWLSSWHDRLQQQYASPARHGVIVPLVASINDAAATKVPGCILFKLEAVGNGYTRVPTEQQSSLFAYLFMQGGNAVINPAKSFWDTVTDVKIASDDLLFSSAVKDALFGLVGPFWQVSRGLSFAPQLTRAQLQENGASLCKILEYCAQPGTEVWWQKEFTGTLNPSVYEKPELVGSIIPVLMTTDEGLKVPAALIFTASCLPSGSSTLMPDVYGTAIKCLWSLDGTTASSIDGRWASLKIANVAVARSGEVFSDSFKTAVIAQAISFWGLQMKKKGGLTDAQKGGIAAGTIGGAAALAGLYYMAKRR